MVIYSYSDSDPNVTTISFPPHGANVGSRYIFFKHQPPVPEMFPPPGTYRLPLQITNVRLYWDVYVDVNLTRGLKRILLSDHSALFEPLHEKICLLGFRPGPTQPGFSITEDD